MGSGHPSLCTTSDFHAVLIWFVYDTSAVRESSNGLFDWLKQIQPIKKPVRTLSIFTSMALFQPIKKPVRTLSIFTSMAFVKDANGISFKNRLKGLTSERFNFFKKCFHQSKVK
jgi:hypothetical protein